MAESWKTVDRIWYKNAQIFKKARGSLTRYTFKTSSGDWQHGPYDTLKAAKDEINKILRQKGAKNFGEINPPQRGLAGMFRAMGGKRKRRK